MPKLLRKITIALVVCSLLVANISANFFVPSKIKAQTVNPPSPGQDTLAFNFTSMGRDQLVMTYTNSSSGTAGAKNYSFIYKGMVLDENSTDADFNTTFGQLMGRRLKEAGLFKPFLRYEYSSDSKYSIIVANKKVNGVPNGLYNVCGLFTPRTGAVGSGGTYISGSFHAIEGDDDSPNLGSLIYTNYIGTPVNYALSNDELCTNMQNTWSQIVDKMRLLLGKKFSENPEYWDEKGLNESTENLITGAVFVRGFAGGLLTAGLAAGAAEVMNNRLDTSQQGYVLTRSGNNLASSINTLLRDLPSIVNSIKDKNNNTWPSGSCRPGKYNGDITISTSEFFNTPADFLSYLGALTSIFNKALADAGLRDEVTEGCGSLARSFLDPFPWLFCKMGDIAHAIASAIMTKAIEWLKASIGLQNVNFVLPAEDTSINQAGGGTGTTTAPTTGTPGTTTPTTPAPLNLRVHLTFKLASGAVSYGLLRAAPTNTWAKVKKKTGSTPIDARVVFSNWSTQVTDTPSVDCVFTTTSNIPADWTAIRIYGGLNGSETVLFVFNVDGYPVASGSINATSE